jgi:hypothetical protein
MFKKVLTAAVGVSAAGVMLATSASAYTMDTTTGTGHVGKGEVQSVFNMNNRNIQDAYKNNDIKFSVTEYEHWQQLCLKKKTQVSVDAYRERTRARNSMGVDALNNQVTSGNLGSLSGFALTGFGDTMRQTEGWGSNPWALDSNSGCPAGSHPSGAPVRTTTEGPLQVTTSRGTKDLTPDAVV